MIVSYNLLKKYVDHDLTAEEVSDILTSTGLESDGVETRESIRGGLRGLVIGKVLTCVPHPNSDHLHITTVDLGSKYSPDGPLQIVCGAPNVAAGQTVVVATIGCTLYDGEESFTIKKSRMRGEDSFGMICAEDEIGLGTAHDGIMVLPDDIPAGTEAADYFGVHSDQVITIDITPNRVDGTSLYGVARDLYAYLRSRGLRTALHKPEVSEIKGEGHPVSLHIDTPEAAPRYAGVVVRGLKVGPSPKWLREALETMGVHPVNNVVDAANFVLMEIGQPLHTFDLNKVKGGEVHVRLAKAGEKLTALDGKEYELTERDLVIADAADPICIAGVIGGKDSGITEETTNMFLECATFHPTYVRKTARRHGLNTDASFRYERGLDPNEIPYALRRAVDLITEVAGGEVASAVYDEYPNPVGPYTIDLSWKRLYGLIGFEIDKAQVRNILESLLITITGEDEEGIHVEVPRYRYDVTHDVDLIEEILRIYGYNTYQAPDQRLTLTMGAPSYQDQSVRYQQVISEQLVGAGFFEILNNSLSKESYYSDEKSSKQAVRVINPLSADLSTLRQTLVHGGLESIERNLNRKATNIRFFEFGNTYTRVDEKEENPLRGFHESFRLGLWMTGDTDTGNWITPEREISVYELKGVLEQILTRMGVNAGEISSEQREDDPLFEKCQVLSLKGGEVFARWGLLDREMLTTMHDIDVPVYFAEIKWDILLHRVLGRLTKATSIPRFPSVKRDFALLVDKSVTFETIKQAAEKAEPKLLRSVELFDVYEDKTLPEGKRSYAVTFELLDPDKTLSDKAIEKTMQKIFNQIEHATGATLR